MTTNENLGNENLGNENNGNEAQASTSLMVSYNGQQIPVDPNWSLDQIKEGMVQLFGDELVNAVPYREEGTNIIRMMIEAGDKGRK